MGGGKWSVDDYKRRAAGKAAAHKSTFDYDDDLRSKPRATWKAHPDLDPSRVNSMGENIREALDTPEHPNATPIAVIFDVTGSMGGIPRVLQEKLPKLLGLLQRKGYVEDPEILFGAVGDAYSDRVPLQIGNFESDNRMDEQLEHLVLEGGGGGGNHESYELALYYFARHTRLDCLKRGKKGYLFVIGDERTYAKIDRAAVRAVIGDVLEETLTTQQALAEAQERFEVFFLFAAEGSYGIGDTLDPNDPNHRAGGDSATPVCYWRDLLGQNALILDDANAVCETIALTLGVMEGTISLDAGLADLAESGATDSAISAANKALAPVGATAITVARSEGALPDTDGKGSTRL
jgi:hypothetical protein